VKKDVEVSAPAGANGEFDLGRWLGRREAFGMMAGRCSAADVECMRRIRDGRLYKSRAGDWQDFCEKELHMSRTNANRLIAQLEEFGPQYFHIAQITRISVANYRAIAPAVSADAIECNGETIPLDEQNSERIAAAVSALSAERRVKQERSLDERLGALEAAGDRLMEQFRELRQNCGRSNPHLTSLAASLQNKIGNLKLEIR
jgi:hypothetical protein